MGKDKIELQLSNQEMIDILQSVLRAASMGLEDATDIIEPEKWTLNIRVALNAVNTAIRMVGE